MERYAINRLKIWKNSSSRKPLIIKGARQVGKTWLMKEFGKRYYDNYVYFNFDEEDEMNSIFALNKNPERIIELLSMISGENIKKHNTLILFDEIQECPEALNSLKYFFEKAPEYHIIAAESLLGTLLSTPKLYPVGKVNVMELYPLSFGEFLNAVDCNLYKYYMGIEKNQSIEEYFHNKLLDAYHLYLIIGGMPECVTSWLNEKDSEKIHEIQNDLLTLYENDFSKHSGSINAGRILLVFRSIVSQLSKENEKFIYGAVKKGARAREFEEAIEWLVSAGMVNRVNNVSKTEHPLPAFDKLDSFKLYMFDTGLLKCMAGVDNKSLIVPTAFQFKGVLAENYVLQQLKGIIDVNPRYYSDKYSEIDFLLQIDGNIIPVEVRNGKNKKATSFKRYIANNEPDNAIRFSENNYRTDGRIINIPLYLVERINELL